MLIVRLASTLRDQVPLFSIDWAVRFPTQSSLASQLYKKLPESLHLCIFASEPASNYQADARAPAENGGGELPSSIWGRAEHKSDLVGVKN